MEGARTSKQSTSDACGVPRICMYSWCGLCSSSIFM